MARTKNKKNDGASLSAKTVKAPPAPDPDDGALIIAIGPPDPALDNQPGSDGPDVAVGPGDLNLVPPGDAAAAAKASGPGQARDPRPKVAPASDVKASDRAPASVPPEVQAFLQPGAIAALVVSINDGLTEKKSPWACFPKEAKNIGEALEAVIDKYFPLNRQWAPELVLAVLLALYLMPRREYMRRKKADPDDGGSGSGPAPARGEKDARLDDV